MKISKIVAAAAVAAAMVMSTGAVSARPREDRPVQRNPRQVVLNGVVTSGDATSFVVHLRGGGRNGRDVTVTTDAATTFRKSDGSAATSADVVVGAKVQLKGAKSADGASVLAKQVMVKVPSAD